MRLAPILVVVSIASSASAQGGLWTVHGFESDQLGIHPSGGWDMSGDGIPDVVVGGNLSSGSGLVSVRSGVDGSILYELLGEKKFDGYGLALAALPDMDGDGLGDFVVGAPRNDWRATDAGSAYLHSGADGSLINVFRGELANGNFGDRIAHVGDLDHDGVADFAISASNDWTAASGSGAVYVYSGATNELHLTLLGPPRSAAFGAGLAGLGDVDGDGTPDLLVGAPYDSIAGDRFGSASVRSGVDGHELQFFTGPEPVAIFGASVAGAGDLDGDGLADFAIAAPNEDAGVADVGRVYVYSGADGHVLFDVSGKTGQQKMGGVTVNVGDVNGDGFDDLVLSDNSDTLAVDAGAGNLISGRTGRLLYRYDGLGAGDSCGIAGPLGDVNGDGRPDVAIGAPGADVAGSGSGTLFAYSGNELYLQTDPDSIRPNRPVTVMVRGGEPGSLYAILVSDVDEVVFLTIVVDVLDSNGEATYAANAPSGLSGEDFLLQAFANGPPNDHRPPLLSNHELLHFQ